MNILHLVSTSGYFGKERCVLELALKQVSTVGILGNQQGTHRVFVEQLREHHVSCVVFPVDGVLDFSAIKGIRTFLQHHAITAIHAHDYKADFYALVSSQGKNIRRTATVHNWITTDLKLWLYAFFDKLLLRYFNAIAVTSPDIQKTLCRYFIPAQKIVVIPNGIALEPFEKKYGSSEMRHSLGISEKAHVIGTVGRLTPEKGHRYLVAAFAGVVKKYSAVHLLVIGSGSEEPTLIETVRAMGIEGQVTFAGIRDNIPEMLSAMDIFVLPSLVEGMPIALLEAMASGVPAIASRVGSIPDIIEHGRNGYLVNPGDPNSIVDAIFFLLNHPEDARSMAVAGRITIKESYSSAHMAEHYAQLYVS